LDDTFDMGIRGTFMFAALLPDRLPWYFAGPALGLLVVGFFLFTNQPLGATGAYIETARTVRRVPGAVVWRAFYFVGIAIGGFIAVSLKDVGFDPRAGYDILTSADDIGLSLPVAAIVIFVGAVVMGYGARMAGGCTSGHGICGTAQRSAASWVVTMTFMATAVITTFFINLI
jgi:uncharacterized membrane protein YedE/YeeE